MSGTPRVTLYGRPGCHLCEDARRVLARVRRNHPFELEECDIESDEVLLRAHLERIPVVSVDGIERFTLFVDEEALVALLAAPGPTTAATRVRSR